MANARMFVVRVRSVFNWHHFLNFPTFVIFPPVRTEGQIRINQFKEKAFSGYSILLHRDEDNANIENQSLFR